MDEKDNEIQLGILKSLIQDEYYYKYIFKKTEKIVSAVFFIIRSTPAYSADDLLIRDIELHALSTLSFAEVTLAEDVGSAARLARELGFRLMTLLSKLRVLSAAGILHGEHLSVFVAEIDSALRSLRQYDGSDRGFDSRVRKTGKEGVRRESTPSPYEIRPAKRTIEGQPDKAPSRQGEGRREQILQVLRATPLASIKDISDTVTAWSEKTIQRELMDLIKDGIVMKEGERRWSKYSLVSR